jgi:choline-sulfatase
MEYAAEGAVAPMVALRERKWKAIWAPPDPPQLFDLEADPHELTNLAGRPDHADVWAGFVARFAVRWELAAFDKAVRASQQRRRLVYEALRQGAYTPWDFEPRDSAERRYMRNDMDLNVVEATQRYPRAG